MRVAIIEECSQGPTLVLCHDYMSAACIEWFSCIKKLSESFRLVMPDMGTYGANSRVQDNSIPKCSNNPDEAEALILDWFECFVSSMGSDLPEKFILAGIANGGYQAGLYASKHPERVEKLIVLSPSEFCPEP